MIRWIREKRENIAHRLKSSRNGKEGASLISVVIGTAFLMAIGLIVITVATKYLTTVYVDRKSTDNFYETEGTLAEVRSGLVEKASARAEDAYDEVMERYTTEKSGSKIRDIFGKIYLRGIAEYLSGNTSLYKYDEMTDAQITAQLGVAQSCGTNSISRLEELKTDAKGSVTTPKYPNGEMHFVLNYDSARGYSITVKDIHIEFKEDPDYLSTIDTDIVFTIPDFRFSGDSTFDELKNYISISDETLNVANSGHSGGTDVTGNVYSGQMDKKDGSKCGVQIDKESQISFDSPKIISRGSLEIRSGSKVSIGNPAGTSVAGDIWFQNIRLLDSSGIDDSTFLNINDNTYISNDLDIQDDNAVVSLAGKYYGYSYSRNNLPTDTDQLDSSYSSAILVNGLNTTLRTAWYETEGDGSVKKDGSGNDIVLQNLDKMVLAGRSFVDRKNNNSGTIEDNTSDIRMGEAISVKSNQLAYLVPSKYLTNGGHNPVSSDGYSLATAVDTTTMLLDTELGKYLDSSNPVTENYMNAGFVYLFLNFKDEVSANQYFYDFFTDATTVSGDLESTASEWLGERSETYLTSTDLTSAETKNRFSNNLYLIAGNIVHNYSASGATAGIQAANYYDSATQKPVEALVNDGHKIAMNYLGNCLTLLPSGSYGRDSDIRLRGDADSINPSTNPDVALVSGKVIDYSRMTAGTFTKTVTAAKTSATVMVVNGPYTVGSSFTGLLIANGDVTVDNDFKGLILTNGKVIVKGTSAMSTHKMDADSILLGDIFELIKTDSSLSYVKSLFYALNGDSKENASEIEKCIFYQNWQKNA